MGGAEVPNPLEGLRKRDRLPDRWTSRPKQVWSCRTVHAVRFCPRQDGPDNVATDLRTVPTTGAHRRAKTLKHLSFIPVEKGEKKFCDFPLSDRLNIPGVVTTRS